MDTLRAILDFWSSYSLTMRIVLFITIGIVFSIWMFLLPWIQGGASNTSAPSSEATKSYSKSEETPQVIAKTELPPIGFGNGVDNLRATNGVRELTNSENDLNLYHLPNGVFGWVEAYKLDSPSFSVPNATFGADFPVAASSTQLRKSKRWNSDVEIHKAQDGIVRILAFVNDSARLQLQQPSRTARIQVLLAFREYEDYRFAVSIPRDRVQWFHHRTFDNGETVADAMVS